jgi:hypothetical protein
MMYRFINQIKTGVSIAVIAIFMASCYPGGPFESSDLDLVVTFYDEEANFQSYQTFSIIDSIIEIGDELDIDQEMVKDIVFTSIRENMIDRGYTEVADPEAEAADLVFAVSALLVDVYEAYTYYDYWWGYWGWYPGWGGYPGYGPGWGPGYGWGGTVIYSYTLGTVLVEMLDPNNPSEEDETIPVVWTAGINGILSSGTSNAGRLESSLQQSFDQSPYLTNN